MPDVLKNGTIRDAKLEAYPINSQKKLGSEASTVSRQSTIQLVIRGLLKIT